MTAPHPACDPSVPGYTAAPGYTAPPAAPGVGAGPPLRSLRGWGAAAAVLLGCQGVVGLAAALVAAWGVLSWSGVSNAPTDLRLPADLAAQALVAVRWPLTLVTGVVFLVWLFVAASNAHRWGAVLRQSSGWAVAGWFVPVLNLWRPKQMLDDVWRASMPGVRPSTDLRRLPRPLLVTGWWVTYLLAGVLPAVGGLRAARSAVVPVLQALGDGAPLTTIPLDVARASETMALWNLWSAVVLVVSAGLAVGVVLRVTGWQQHRVEAQASASR